MVTSAQCRAKYGDPEKENNLSVLIIPAEYREKNKALPYRVYCNRDIHGPLLHALCLLDERGLLCELKTWNGCFEIRKKRGLASMSLHSWGLAVDVNAAENPLGAKPVLSAEFVACWTEAGFDWGGNWSRPDGMHFQIKTL